MCRAPVWLAATVAVVTGCAGDEAVTSGPARLSETGLYADFAGRVLSDGLLRPSPRFPLWSDAAEKERYLALPNGSAIDTSDMDAWRFPVGTRVWKTFSFAGRPIETRFLEKRRSVDEGGWFQMSYAWRDDLSDADAVPDGVKNAAGRAYDIPSQRICGGCHYKGEKPVIGISAMQLSRSDGEAPIDAFVAAGALSSPPTRRFAVPGSAVEQAALGYLHGNCSHCHDSRSAARDEVRVYMELRVDDALATSTSAYRSLVGQPPHHFPDVGVTAEVQPGSPELSLVYYRMNRRDAAQMPPLATRMVDTEGLGSIAAWITALPK